MELQLQGKHVLITGGSKGIGRSCAEVMAAEGCHLHLVARSQDDLEQTRQALTATFDVPVNIHPVDLSQGDQARVLIETCAHIDILVNNAGAIPSGDLWAVDEPRWREAWDLKVFGYINICRAIYPHMRDRGRGVIINVIGGAGERPNAHYIAGGAGNAALMAFTKAMGAASPDDGIRIVGVNPGLIHTERLETLLRTLAHKRFQDAERWRDLLPQKPPPGAPEDIAHVVAFLASDKAKNISGTTILADGGATSR